MSNIYINSNLESLIKFSSSNRSKYFKDKNDHEDRSSQYDNSHMLCDEKWYPLLGFKESQWKPWQQLDQIFPMERGPL